MNKEQQTISDKKFYKHTGYFPEFEDLPIDYLKGKIIEYQKEIEDLEFAVIGFQDVIDQREGN